MIESHSRFEPRRNSTRAGNQVVNYLSSGIDDHDATPLLLIHSAGSDAAVDFEFLMPMLSRHRLTVAVELPVLAGSPTASTLFEAYRDSIDAVLDAELLSDRGVAIAGASLGGTIALNYAALNPMVHQVILVTSWAAPSWAMILHARMIRRLIIKAPTVVDDYLLLIAHSDTFLGTRGAKQLERESWDPHHRRLYQQAQLMEMLDTSDYLADLSVPCLIIAAAIDRLVPAASSAALAASLASGVIAWVSTGHGAIAERPAEVLALMDDFLVNPSDYLRGTPVGAHRP